MDENLCKLYFLQLTNDTVLQKTLFIIHSWVIQYTFCLSFWYIFPFLGLQQQALIFGSKASTYTAVVLNNNTQHSREGPIPLCKPKQGRLNLKSQRDCSSPPPKRRYFENYFFVCKSHFLFSTEERNPYEFNFGWT